MTAKQVDRALHQKKDGFRVLEGEEREHTGTSVVNGDARTPYVAIIGAGAAGLAAGRLLSEAGARPKKRITNVLVLDIDIDIEDIDL